jgi:[ribosomal protein S5]-alanine N-acetyltransferase
MMSERLEYRPVTAATLDDFHRLVQDEHVRRYLMDGELFPREWSEQRVRDSASLFERCGVGLWLVHQRETGNVVGFCGFLDIPSVHPQPQLLYAIFERFTGQGYATEMARASIAEARRYSDLSTIVASVDEANVASVRVLEKLGFRRTARPPRCLRRCALVGARGVVRRSTDTLPQVVVAHRDDLETLGSAWRAKRHCVSDLCRQ